MVTDVAHLLGRQARVDGHQNRSRQRNCEVRDQQLGDVRAQVGHAVARLDPRRLQRAGEASGFAGEIAIGHAAIAVDDRHLVGVHLGGTLQETQRRQRGVRHGGHGGLLSSGRSSGGRSPSGNNPTRACTPRVSAEDVQPVRTRSRGRKTPRPAHAGAHVPQMRAAVGVICRWCRPVMQVPVEDENPADAERVCKPRCTLNAGDGRNGVTRSDSEHEDKRKREPPRRSASAEAAALRLEESRTRRSAAPAPARSRSAVRAASAGRAALCERGRSRPALAGAAPGRRRLKPRPRARDERGSAGAIFGT